MEGMTTDPLRKITKQSQWGDKSSYFNHFETGHEDEKKESRNAGLGGCFCPDLRLLVRFPGAMFSQCHGESAGLKGNFTTSDFSKPRDLGRVVPKNIYETAFPAAFRPRNRPAEENYQTKPMGR